MSKMRMRKIARPPRVSVGCAKLANPFPTIALRLPPRERYGDILMLETGVADVREAGLPEAGGWCEGNPPGWAADVLKAVGGWDHRCWSFVDGVHDLGVVDPA